MDVKEFIDSLNNLDPENIGGWPLPVKILIWVVACVAAGFLVFHLFLCLLYTSPSPRDV